MVERVEPEVVEVDAIKLASLRCALRLCEDIMAVLPGRLIFVVLGAKHVVASILRVQLVRSVSRFAAGCLLSLSTLVLQIALVDMEGATGEQFRLRWSTFRRRSVVSSITLMRKAICNLMVKENYLAYLNSSRERGGVG